MILEYEGLARGPNALACRSSFMFQRNGMLISSLAVSRYCTTSKVRFVHSVEAFRRLRNVHLKDLVS